jgi:hypothetical protein
MNPKRLAAALAGGRVALGIGLALAPRRLGRTWIGEDATLPGGVVAVRATGVRDVAVGLGLLVALRRGRPLRGWLEAGAVTDMGDLVFTLLSFPQLPRVGRLVTIASAGASALVAMRMASRIDASEVA